LESGSFCERFRIQNRRSHRANVALFSCSLNRRSIVNFDGVTLRQYVGKPLYILNEIDLLRSPMIGFFNSIIMSHNLGQPSECNAFLTLQSNVIHFVLIIAFNIYIYIPITFFLFLLYSHKSQLYIYIYTYIYGLTCHECILTSVRILFIDFAGLNWIPIKVNNRFWI